MGAILSERHRTFQTADLDDLMDWYSGMGMKWQVMMNKVTPQKKTMTLVTQTAAPKMMSNNLARNRYIVEFIWLHKLSQEFFFAYD